MHVPGWHKATEQLQEDGALQMVGIIQEQHPDRARLFMQLKEMDWPILVDSYDLLETSAVPITFAIDENGIIRDRLPSPQKAGNLIEIFLETNPVTGEKIGKIMPPNLDALRHTAESRQSSDAWKSYADALIVWGGPDRIDHIISAYREAARLDPSNAMTHFRLGVAYRMRYDSEHRRDGDFRLAVNEWSTGLEIDPNQYILRRRIQQYGPRLDKPYPFYDWVPAAREEIIARGEQPVPLLIEPRGSEYAAPERSFTTAGEAVEPDPAGRVLRDNGQYIRVEIVSVPPGIAPGNVMRAHLVFNPNATTLAHWNNEAEEMKVWVDPPAGWAVNAQLLTHPIPLEAATKETRAIEVEIRAPEQIIEGNYCFCNCKNNIS